VECKIESLELILPLCNLHLKLKRYVIFEAFGNMLLDKVTNVALDFLFN
jgi:hypothetical protein